MNTNFCVLREKWSKIDSIIDMNTNADYAAKRGQRVDMGYIKGQPGKVRHTYPQQQDSQSCQGTSVPEYQYDARAKGSSQALSISEGGRPTSVALQHPTRHSGENVGSHSHSGYGERSPQERSKVEQMLVMIWRRLDSFAADQSSHSHAQGYAGQSSQSVPSLSNERIEEMLQNISSRLERLENGFVERSTDAVEVPSKMGQILEDIVSRLDRLEKQIMESAVLVDTTSDVHAESGAEGGFLSRLSLFGTHTSRKPDTSSKKQLLESLSEKEQQIMQLHTQLKSYEQIQHENKSNMTMLRQEMKWYKEGCERMSAELKAYREEKKRMQAAYMEERSWQDGHHDKTSGLKKPGDVSKDYETLFTNNAHSVLKHVKHQQHCKFTVGEFKGLLCNVFQVAFDTCKKKHLSAMFEELFKPQSEDSLKLAREQARIYGSLSQKDAPISPDDVATDVIKQIKVRLPQLLPVLCEEPMLAFVKAATATAMNMVSMHPPMFVTCPPASVRSFSPALHKEKGWNPEDPPEHDTPLIYFRPILHASYLSDHPEVLGWVALHPTSDDKIKQPRKAVKAPPVTKATRTEYENPDEDSESDL